MRTFGLIGFPLSHSFSPDYFNKKFQQQNIEAIYKTFPLKSINDFFSILNNNPTLEGLNVTIPYKETIISYLDEISSEAKEIGAVNCINIVYKNKKPYLIGYNTDFIGFEKSFIPCLKPHHKKALVLGNGGAAKAIKFVLKKLDIPFKTVVRTIKNKEELLYTELNKELLNNYTIIINTTPLGTYPETENCPDIPYHFLNNSHFLYDLIYNPAESLFLKKGKLLNAEIKNGYEMLVIQAEESWKIWNNQ
ncbi:MAG: shikimate dehydrogenase family protein [Bacteroidia bacterium]